MDESTLNDLLECSVCLERLDDSKVLPCQHTFCKKCLEVIVASQKALRCPECRILVNSKIDDLPPNVLLMRILEGLKNSANQNAQSPSNKPETSTSSNILKIENKTYNSQQSSNRKVNHNFSSSSNISNVVHFQQKSSSNQPNLNKHHQTSPQIRQNHSSGVQNIPKAFALYDFQSKDIGDLQFHKGDVILIKKRIDTNWLYGALNGREGTFPVNYVQIIVPLPVPQCIALYDFKMGPNEEEGCLAFKKGTVINVLRRVDQNWAEGRIGSNIGIFPIAFAEMNSLAKHILQQKETELCLHNGSKHIHTNARITALPPVPRSLPPLPILDTNLSDSTTSSSSSALMSPNSTCSSSSNSISNSPINQSQSKIPENVNVNIRHRNANKEKRNSLNGLTVNKSLSVAQSNRHSAEILSVPHENIQSSQQQVGSSAGNVCVLSSSVNSSVPASYADSGNIDTKNSTQIYRANVLKQQSNVPQTLPWCYMALYPYKPKKNDELELKKGCVYIVTERCLDGWFKGKNWLEKSGVFPGNYVAPLRNRDHQQLMHQKKNTQGNDNMQPLNPCNPISCFNNVLPELPPRTTNNSGAGTISTLFSKNDRSEDQIDSAAKQISTLTDSNEHKNIAATSNDSKELTSHKITSNQLLASTTSSVSNLMKRLTNMKRSKSPTPQTVQIDEGNFQGNISNNKDMSHPVHVRSGSCPSQLLQSLPVDVAKENIVTGAPKNDSLFFGSQRLKGQKDRPSLQSISATGSNTAGNGGTSVMVASNPPITVNMIHHRKTQSLDTTCRMNQLTVNNSIKTNNNREGRFRCIVSYPPNSEFELELNVGDIVFVHRKQKNGWYKGTHSKTNKTGLFPASFVEPLL